MVELLRTGREISENMHFYVRAVFLGLKANFFNG